MAEALFYHLTVRTLEQALPELLLRTLARDWRAVVRCGSEPRVEDLTRRLWSFDDASFLPHGSAADGDGARQPIYLTAGQETPNQPDILFLVDQAEAEVSEFAAYERVCLLFDGRDEAAVTAARGLWRAVADAKTPAVYWAEAPGEGWVKKAESRPE